MVKASLRAGKQMKRVSYSQYKTWVECPYRWKLKYIDGLDSFDHSIYTIFGTSIHRVIQDWLEQDLYSDSVFDASSINLSQKFKSILIEEAAPHMKHINENGEQTFLFSREELEEFYEQGLKIISYVQQNQEKLFPTKNVKLFAIEHELKADVNDHVYFIGYIDIITHNEVTGEYSLYDLKTSTRGWNKYMKLDKTKTDQLLLYKIFFAKEMGIPDYKVNIGYLIMKRELYETSYPNPRVTEFAPSNGPPSLKRAWSGFNNFTDLVFSDEGSYISEQEATLSKNSCRFCSFGKDGTCEFVYGS